MTGLSALLLPRLPKLAMTNSNSKQNQCQRKTISPLSQYVAQKKRMRRKVWRRSVCYPRTAIMVLFTRRCCPILSDLNKWTFMRAIHEM
jgi:hypothetical protein